MVFPTVLIFLFALGLVPVCLFLMGLVYLDSFKLVSMTGIAKMIAAGSAAAGVSYLVNRFLFARLPVDLRLLTIFVAPLVEELLKAMPILFLIRRKKIGFLVDAAICGFAIGTGFALVENVYYFQALPRSGPGLWLVRGFGTAIMHGGSTAIVAIMAKALTSRQGGTQWFVIPGLLAAYSFHALFNSFLVPPIISAIVVILVFPILVVLVFGESEESLRSWLGSGFDLDSELIENINSGEFTESAPGKYLQSLRDHFDGAVLADMLCMLRLNAELALRAKGILMMRESGFDAKPDAETIEKLHEIAYLKEAIGRTGELAVAPILHSSEEDVWQLQLLQRRG